MTHSTAPSGELVLYQTDDGRPRIECRFEGDTLWLTQAQVARLFETCIPNINIHLRAIYKEGELDAGATIKPYLMVRTEGSRQIQRSRPHYSLPAILAVGFRVRGAHPVGDRRRRLVEATQTSTARRRGRHAMTRSEPLKDTLATRHASAWRRP